MNAIKATVMQGRLELKVPLDWPDGTEVLIEPTMAPLEKIGIDESEWRDDPESLADWEAWIKTIEPFELTPHEAKRIADFAEQMREYNVQAVRRQQTFSPRNPRHFNGSGGAASPNVEFNKRYLRTGTFPVRSRLSKPVLARKDGLVGGIGPL